MMMTAPAVVGVASSSCLLDGSLRYVVSSQCTAVLINVAEVLPVILPLTGVNQTMLLDRLDGLVFPGAITNLQPWLYDGHPDLPDAGSDPARDATTLPLIRAAVAAGLPIIGCGLGMQEMNVALGGTLRRRPDAALPRLPGEDNDGDQHAVRLSGRLARICQATAITVHSRQEFGIDRVAEQMVVEALAADGTIEGLSSTRSPGFAVAVQWNPEENAPGSNHHLALFRAFGEACRQWSARRELLATG
jgi:putative glutamine amidotransferase